jgi:hypothetical protein
VLVEVVVVDTHPPLLGVLLADEDGVGEPLRMEDFSDDSLWHPIGRRRNGEGVVVSG